VARKDCAAVMPRAALACGGGSRVAKTARRVTAGDTRRLACLGSLSNLDPRWTALLEPYGALLSP